MKAGINLFTVHKLIDTEKGLITTAQKLKEMGYDYFQFSGTPYDAIKAIRLKEEVGIPICLTHIPYDKIVGETDAMMEEHARFGCFNIGLGMLMPKVVSDEKEFKKKLDELNLVGEKMSKNGFKLFYHNHQFEFCRWQNGERPIDYILNNAKNVNLTVDTYWVQYGGVNISDLIENFSGRVDCVHLKDYKIEWGFARNEEEQLMPRFAPIGSGNTDFKKVIDSCLRSGTKYFLVEQDDASTVYDDPLAQAKLSIDYIKRNF